LLELARSVHCNTRPTGMSGSYLGLVTQPAVTCRRGLVIEVVEPVGAAVEAVEPVCAAVEAVGPVGAAVVAIEPVGAAFVAIELVDAETGDVRDEVVCASHG
jgi:hypothetical protein